MYKLAKLGDTVLIECTVYKEGEPRRNVIGTLVNIKKRMVQVDI